MTANPTLRRIGADPARPKRLADALLHKIENTADAIARWAWVRAYSRAETRYWGDSNK